jgi:hypothetical protein
VVAPVGSRKLERLAEVEGGGVGVLTGVGLKQNGNCGDPQVETEETPF